MNRFFQSLRIFLGVSPFLQGRGCGLLQLQHIGFFLKNLGVFFHSRCKFSSGL